MRVSKFIPAVLFVMLPVFGAFAASVDYTTPLCSMMVLPAVKYGDIIYQDSCYQTGALPSACYDCDTSTITYNGVVTTTYRGVSPSIVSEVQRSDGLYTTTIECVCTIRSSTYECAPGYYGTATGLPLVGQDSTECIACPDNATCAGGNGSTFVCDSGYVKTDTGCTKCADGEWMNGTVCEPCPTISDQDPNSSSNAVPHTPNGATSITQCYYLQTSLITDGRGTYYFNNDCNYGAAE